MKVRYTWLAVILALLNAIGPFAIDAYLPAFPDIQHSLGVGPVAMQQSLTAYMLPFSIMMLWHGAISDALGRRRVILWGLSVFVLASLICAATLSLHMLLLGRTLQGLSAGVGVIVGRAVVRDVLDGVAAQRLMSRVAMVFSIAPAVAPIVGGALITHLGWRSVFILMAVLGVSQIFCTWRFLPETLAPEKRQSLHPVSLFKAYLSILGSPAFVAISLSGAFFFAAFFIYVMSAPVFLMRHLHLASTQFGWLFVPVVCGMMVGSALAGRLAGRLSERRTIVLAFAIAVGASVINLAANYFLPDSVATRIPQLALHTLAVNLAFPSMTLIALDMFPARRGMAASCQGFLSTLVMATGAGAVAPLLWGSTLTLAWGTAGSLTLAILSFAVFCRTHPADPATAATHP